MRAYLKKRTAVEAGYHVAVVVDPSDRAVFDDGGVVTRHIVKAVLKVQEKLQVVGTARVG